MKEKEQRREQKQKEEEEKQMKRQKREEERKRKLEEKEKKIAAKKVKKVQRTEKEIEVSMNAEEDCGEKIGRLAAKKFTCGVCGERGRVTDEANGIEWYGCDDDMCMSGWYHFKCLSSGEKELLRESLEEENVFWYCKNCIPFLYED